MAEEMGKNMIEYVKWYLLNVGIRKYVPMGLMAGMASLAAIMAAHAGMLEQWGITYSSWPFTWSHGQGPSGPCILIELDTLSKATVAGIFSLVTMALAAFQHHTTGTTGIPGGRRAIDPPASTDVPIVTGRNAA